MVKGLLDLLPIAMRGEMMENSFQAGVFVPKPMLWGQERYSVKYQSREVWVRVP